VCRHVDGDREADADVAAALAVDRAVDADHLTADVEQRPAGVAGIDGRVGLNEIVVRPGSDRPSLGADDAGGDGLAETERIADREHPIADAQIVAVRQLRGGERLIRLDADQRDVGLLVSADDLRLVPLLVLEHDLDLVGGAEHVVVGEDLALWRDDHTRAEAALLVALRHLIEEPAHEVFHRVAGAATRHLGALHRLRCRDVHHGGNHVLDDVRERRGWLGGAGGEGRRVADRQQRRTQQPSRTISQVNPLAVSRRINREDASGA